MITLVDMADSRYEAYVEQAIVRYAEEGGRATATPPDAAMVRARRQFAALLPGGRVTEGQYFKSLVDDDGAEVGILWYAAELDATPPHVFIYDIEVDDGQQGRGFGSAALRLLEEEARRLGAAALMLAVFDHNEGAIRLYERLGFTTVQQGEGGRRMAKAV